MYDIPPGESPPGLGDRADGHCSDPFCCHCLGTLSDGQQTFPIPEFGEVHAACAGYCPCESIWPWFVLGDRQLLLATCAGCARRAADWLAEEVSIRHAPVADKARPESETSA